jgi:hypothetical protein
VIKEKAGVMKVDEIGYHSQFPCVQLYSVIIQCLPYLVNSKDIFNGQMIKEKGIRGPYGSLTPFPVTQVVSLLIWQSLGHVESMPFIDQATQYSSLVFNYPMRPSRSLFRHFLL